MSKELTAEELHAEMTGLSGEVFKYQRLFLAAVKAAGGSLRITQEDFENPPIVGAREPEEDGSILFEIVEEDSE